MNAQAVIRAEVDINARLTQGDPALEGLQARAGGTVDGPLIIPQLARLAKLAMRLGTPISRPILAGDAENDVSMWVRVVPHHEGASLEIVDWTETDRADSMLPADGRAVAPRVEPPADEIIPPKVWKWACNLQLRLTDLSAVHDSNDTVLKSWIGYSLSECFKFRPDERGHFPILQALASQQQFTTQLAQVALDDCLIAELEGEPAYDAAGKFKGYRGTATCLAMAPKGGAVAEDGEPTQTILSPDGDDADTSNEATAGDLNTSDNADTLDNAFLEDQFPSEDVADAAPAVEEDHSNMLGLGARAGDFSRRIDGALRRPLGRIIANAETISGRLEGPIRQDYADYASDIAAAGRHLMGLIDDLADLQAIERPDFNPAREDVDLADLGRRTAGLLAMKAREKSIRIDAPSLDDSIVSIGEFRRVLQILINLVGNAIRYSPEGSQIFINAEVVDGKAIVTIADQGRGISADEQEKIFEKFERLGRDDHGGSGLGLYIARRLARAMDGDIIVDSAPDEGARFSLTLPAKI